MIRRNDLLLYSSDSVGSRNAGPPHIKAGHCQALIRKSRSLVRTGLFFALKYSRGAIDFQISWKLCGVESFDPGIYADDSPVGEFVQSVDYGARMIVLFFRSIDAQVQ